MSQCSFPVTVRLLQLHPTGAANLPPLSVPRSSPFPAALGFGLQGREPGEPHREQGQLWGQGEMVLTQRGMNQRTDRVIPGIPSALGTVSLSAVLRKRTSAWSFREPPPANIPWSASICWILAHGQTKQAGTLSLV